MGKHQRLGLRHSHHLLQPELRGLESPPAATVRPPAAATRPRAIAARATTPRTSPPPPLAHPGGSAEGTFQQSQKARALPTTTTRPRATRPAAGGGEPQRLDRGLRRQQLLLFRHGQYGGVGQRAERHDEPKRRGHGIVQLHKDFYRGRSAIGRSPARRARRGLGRRLDLLVLLGTTPQSQRDARRRPPPSAAPKCRAARATPPIASRPRPPSTASIGGRRGT